MNKVENPSKDNDNIESLSDANFEDSKVSSKKRESKYENKLKKILPNFYSFEAVFCCFAIACFLVQFVQWSDYWGIEKSEIDFLWHKLKQIFTFGVRPMNLDVQLQQKLHSKCPDQETEQRKTQPDKTLLLIFIELRTVKVTF